MLFFNYELTLEGRFMNHCVPSYSNSCQMQRCSIWSLREKHPYYWKSLTTLEINAFGELVQAKAARNGQPSKRDIHFIKKWLDLNGIKYQVHKL